MTELGGHARYAIYWAPPHGSWLEAFGASWMGRDAEADEQRMRIRTDLPLERMTEGPARYGFHGTLKAPFALAEGGDAADLHRALADYAARTAPATAPALAPDADLGFVALRPSGPAPALDALALDIVETFDRFRAPLDAETLARRRAAGLTPAQDANLRRYGYPHVGAEFRFHVTLTNAVGPTLAADVVDTVAPLVAPYLDPVFRLDELALFAEPAAGKAFRLIRRYPLRG